MKKWCILLLMLITAGCASKKDALSREYDEISQKIEALRNEEKAVVSLDTAISDYLKASKAYEQSVEKLQEVKEKNESSGFPVGPDFDEHASLEDQQAELKKNQDEISDQVYQLENEREEIVKQQSQLD